MTNNNLPVILLKGLVLLPHEDARIELNNDITKKVLDISKLYHNSEVLIVTPINGLEESPDTTDLPKVGVVAKVTSNIELPNGKTRIILTGIKRVKVLNYINYSNEKDVLQSIIIDAAKEEYNEIEETALLRKLIEELEKYISINPYISNAILSKIKNITDLDKITDYIANFIPLSNEKKQSFMLDLNRKSRAKKLITEINIELAILEIESKIELTLKRNIDEMQKEMILKEKIKAIKEELGEKDNKTEYIEKITNQIQGRKIPPRITKRIEYELKRYELTPESSPEIGVIMSYIDYLISIPWGILKQTTTDLKEVEENLNKTHYGLEEVKTRILEYISVMDSGKNINSPIICLVGPPGVGKTSMAESIAASLNKDFVKISLGGINDPAELLGHRKTYVGSEPGKIIKALIKAKSKNPLILLDEIDKLGTDYKGDPRDALLDLLDIKSNKEFVDAYIEENVDLSNVTWIITANDKNLIPYVLLDRLEIIEVESYLPYEKAIIALEYLIPNAKNKNGLEDANITFTSGALNKIIDSYTKESGVRDLDRLINKIIRKIILKHKKENKKIEEIIIDEENIIEYLGYEKYPKDIKTFSKQKGYAKGLAYTPYGGEILEIEVTSYEGKEEFITSGSLGEVIEESIKIALSYIKANQTYFKIKKENLNKTFHINFREGAIPKDGPSAGIIITTTILSHLLNKGIPSNISMTGEITLLGDILPIGGLREKSLAAIREGINKIYVSKYNKRDIFKLDKDIQNKVQFIQVSNYKEIYQDIWGDVKNGKR